MTTTLFSHKALTAAAATVLGLSLLPFGAPTADAATITKAVPSSCRTNGAPLGYDVTRTKQDSLTITTPDKVEVGEEFNVALRYQPEVIPGKENIATMKQLRDIVLRFTIDDPSSFVTARLSDNGQNVFGSPQVALVGGNRLVLSGMNVNVNGQDTHWAPPTVTLTLRATAAGTVPTIHPAVEGAAGQFNNSANFMTMKTVTDTKLGEMNLQLNCQATSSAATFASVTAGDGAAQSTHKKAAKKATAGKKSVGKHSAKSSKASATGHSATSKAGTSSTTAVDPHNLTVDEDIYATPEKGGLPTWVNAMIVLAAVGATGGIGYRYYNGKNRKED